MIMIIKSSLQRSLPHKPTCDPLTPTYSLVQFVLAITCCSFGPIGRPDVLQLPLIASAESWSKIDSEGTLVEEVVAWVVAMATAGRCCRCQVVLFSFLLTRCDFDSAPGLQPQILSPHCALCAVCMQHAAFPRFSPPISHHPAYGPHSRGIFSLL